MLEDRWVTIDETAQEVYISALPKLPTKMLVTATEGCLWETDKGPAVALREPSGQSTRVDDQNCASSSIFAAFRTWRLLLPHIEEPIPRQSDFLAQKTNSTTMASGANTLVTETHGLERWISRRGVIAPINAVRLSTWQYEFYDHTSY